MRIGHKQQIKQRGQDIQNSKNSDVQNPSRNGFQIGVNWRMSVKKRPLDGPGAAGDAVKRSSAESFKAGGPDLPVGACVPLKDYEQICRVGEGTFGLVYKARHRKSGELVALKKVILHYEQQDGVRPCLPWRLKRRSLPYLRVIVCCSSR